MKPYFYSATLALFLLLVAVAYFRYDTRESDIEFLFEDSYEAGSKIEVKVKNLSSTTYVFNRYFAACDLDYADSDNRHFKVPPGTHCDLLAEEEIRPGQTATLFIWRLDECIVDDWGCMESRPLSAGRYTMSGEFRAKDGDSTTLATGIVLIR